MLTSTVIRENHGGVTLLRLHRPAVHNALNREMLAELLVALQDFDESPSQRCAVITGNGRAFAAGADIAEMADKSFAEAYAEDFLAVFDKISAVRKPLIAAVSGVALGGGCELAMACDLIIADQTARFGQPEITLGIIPGVGGTQRLARAVGKSMAMDLCLTGRFLDAAEAERAGLVSRLVHTDDLVGEALAMAAAIARMPRLASLAAKEAVSAAFETSLATGLRFERRLFQSLFATSDQKEGMAAFLEKRPASWE